MMTRDIEYQPGCHRIERKGEVVARYITSSYGEIKWSVVYANAGSDALGDMIRRTLCEECNSTGQIMHMTGGLMPCPDCRRPR